MGIETWGNTAAGNLTDWDGTTKNISTFDDQVRIDRAAVKEWYNDPGWIIYNPAQSGTPTFTRLSNSVFEAVGGSAINIYHKHRRVKAVGTNTGTIYGVISDTSTFTGGNTRVTVAWDTSDVLDADDDLVVYLSSQRADRDQAPGLRSYGSDGYLYLPDGSLMVWGRYTGAAHGPTINFDPNFVDAIHHVSCTPESTGARMVTVDTVGTGSFIAYQWDAAGNTSTSNFRWLVIGR